MNANEPAPTLGLSLPFTKAADPTARFHIDAHRLPALNKLPTVWRNHFVAVAGEFVGTTLFLYFALSGAQVANSIKSSAGLTVAETGANPQQLQYIALSFGFSLAVFAWVFFRISGGLFNPAVTLGMCLIGALPWFRGTLLFFTQILGGMAASGLVGCMFPGDLNVQTTLGGGCTVVQGLFIEMILTAQLVFTIFMLAAEKHKGTFIAPIGIGLSLFVAELTGVFFTGGSLNPARSFGPAVYNHHFEYYHWIYWVGPILGSLLAAGFFKFIKALEYESANPDQDTDHVDKHGNRIPPVASAFDAVQTRASHATLTNGNEDGYVAEKPAAVPAVGFGAALATRPEVARVESVRERAFSPGINTADNAYAGLAHGMHGEDRPVNTRMISEAV